MNISTREIDHLVYCVPNLEEAISWFEEKTGVRPVVGGKHLTKGTKNALVNLGNKCYLELIAADFGNTSFRGSRWMGIDDIKAPKMSRWSLKSENLAHDRKILINYHPEMGVIDGGQRKTEEGEVLHWEMILPLATPSAEVIPFMTDWQNSSIHPTDNLPEACLLISVSFYHPEPMKVTPVFNKLGLTNEILRGSLAKISAKIETPKGLLVLE